MNQEPNNNFFNQNNNNYNQPMPDNFNMNQGARPNPGYDSNTQQNQNNGGNKKIIIIVGIVILLLALIGIISSLNKPEKTFDDYVKDYEAEKTETKKEILKKITYTEEDVVTSDSSSELIFSLTSTNNKFVDISIPIKFYDESNVQIKEDTMYFSCVESGVKLYDISTIYDKNYAKYKLDEEDIDVRYSSYYSKCVSYKNKIDSQFEKADEDGKANLIITNNTSKKLSINGYVFQYSGGKIVDVDIVLLDSVDANSKVKDEIHAPYNYTTHSYTNIEKREFVLSRVDEK